MYIVGVIALLLGIVLFCMFWENGSVKRWRWFVWAAVPLTLVGLLFVVLDMPTS